MNAGIKMLIEIFYGIQLLFGLIIVITGLSKYHKINLVSRLVIFMVANTIINDLLTSSLEKNIAGLNLFLQYSFLSDLVLNSLFLHYCIDGGKKKYVYPGLIALGILFWLVNLLYFLPFSDTKNNFWYYEAFLSLSFITTSLIAVSKMLKKQSLQENFKDPAFRFILIFMFAYASFFIMGITIPLVRREHLYYILVACTWLFVDISFLAIELTFLTYPKKNAALH